MGSELKRIWHGDEGQDLTEYALLLMLISLVAFATLKNVAATVNHLYSSFSAAGPTLGSGMTISVSDVHSNMNSLSAGS